MVHMHSVGERQRPELSFYVDGRPRHGLEGDTVLTALLVNGHCLRHTEVSGAPRAGFCIMGACQDCWIWLADGTRLRACTTPVAEAMAICTSPPSGWSDHG